MNAVRRFFSNMILGKQITQAAERVEFAMTTPPVTDDDRHWDEVNNSENLTRRYTWDRRNLQSDCRKVWRENPLARRAVEGRTDVVVSRGYQITSRHPEVDEWLVKLITHPKNRLGSKMHPHRIVNKLDTWCSELTNTGEIYMCLFTNPSDGVTYFRGIPSNAISEVKTNSEDTHDELAYTEGTPPWETTTWKAYPYNVRGPEVMHFTINQLMRNPHGESDTGPALPWIRRYQRYLEDRIRFNAHLMQWAWTVNLTGMSPEEEKARRREIKKQKIRPGQILVSSDMEKWSSAAPDIKAWGSKDDGQAVKGMAANGLNFPSAWLGEGSGGHFGGLSQGDIPARNFERRKDFFILVVAELLTRAFQRAQALGLLTRYADPAISIESVGDTRKIDAVQTANAGQAVQAALQPLFEEGLLEGPRYREIVLRFIGEFRDDI